MRHEKRSFLILKYEALRVLLARAGGCRLLHDPCKQYTALVSVNFRTSAAERLGFVDVDMERRQVLV